MSKIKLCWKTQAGNEVANALGYNTHNKAMKRWGAAHFDYNDDAPVALHIVPADQFVPVAGKKNVLFTMWEFMQIPTTYKAALNMADAVITPCRWCNNLFRESTNKPIYTCFEGVDPSVYKFHKRSEPDYAKGERFRYLWVGAPNMRKGYPALLAILKQFEDDPTVEVYFKTTAPRMTWAQYFMAIWKMRGKILRGCVKAHEWTAIWRQLYRIPTPSLAGKVRRCGKHKNVVFDTRYLSQHELVALYNSAHAFVLPSFGEGWGLTLSEAMATGAPCISTRHTGISDFFDDSVGYVIGSNVMLHDLPHYQMKAQGYVPRPEEVAAHMHGVKANYAEALQKGRLASERITKRFTWENSARRLAEIIREVHNGVDNDSRS